MIRHLTKASDERKGYIWLTGYGLSSSQVREGTQGRYLEEGAEEMTWREAILLLLVHSATYILPSDGNAQVS